MATGDIENPGPAFFDNAWRSPVSLEEHDWTFLVSLLAEPDVLSVKELGARWAGHFEAHKIARGAAAKRATPRPNDQFA